MGFAQIRRVLGSRGDEGGTRQQTHVAANCLYISGFWGLRHRPPPGLHPWTPLGGLPCSRPSVPTLTSEPGYATGRKSGRQTSTEGIGPVWSIVSSTHLRRMTHDMRWQYKRVVDRRYLLHYLFILTGWCGETGWGFILLRNGLRVKSRSASCRVTSGGYTSNYTQWYIKTASAVRCEAGSPRSDWRGVEHIMTTTADGNCSTQMYAT